MIDPKPLRMRFDKIDAFIRIYEETRYLVLLGPKKYDAFYNRIRYLFRLKSSIMHILSHYFAQIKVDVLPIKNWPCIML